MGARVLITGLGTFWGSRLAQHLETRDDIDVIVGLDVDDPCLPLERTDFVRADSSYSILHRIVEATEIDTILHTHLVVDSTQASGRAMHEINVIGTMNLLAAAGAPDSTVRKVVVKGSTLVYGAGYQDPYFFRESTARTHGPKTSIERSLLEVEAFLRDFAEDNPHVVVSLLRFTNVLGDNLDTPFSKALRLPVVPEVFGFDPKLQFTHESDVEGALMFTTLEDIPGVYNVAGDGTLPWSEVCSIVGKRRIAISPIATNWAAEPLRILGLVDMAPEMLALLRYGRGVDNTRFKGAGYRYRYSSAATVDQFARGLRLERTVGSRRPTYKYERDVETFFRHSSAVVNNRP
jgi:UDP-glucose 4-epimerase